MSQVSITIRDTEGRRQARRRFDRILDVLFEMTKGFAIMSAAQDRFDASFKAYQQATDKKLADLQKQLDEKSSAAPDTSAADEAFTKAADELDAATKALDADGSISEAPASGNALTSGSSSSAASPQPSSGSDVSGNDTAGLTTSEGQTAPGGSPSDALAGGASGTSTPSPVVSVP